MPIYSKCHIPFVGKFGSATCPRVFVNYCKGCGTIHIKTDADVIIQRSFCT